MYLGYNQTQNIFNKNLCSMKVEAAAAGVTTKDILDVVGKNFSTFQQFIAGN